MSNIDDLDRLVAVFMKQEDEHFSLFNYIQTVNQETDQQLEKTEELEVGGLSRRGDGGTVAYAIVTANPRRQFSTKRHVVLLLRVTQQTKRTCSVVDNSTAPPKPARTDR